MSSQGDPRDPSRSDSGLSEISAAADRARRRLQEEIGQLRAGIEQMLVQQSTGESTPRGGALPKVARGASFGLIGLMGAIALAIPATIAVREGLPLIKGGAIPGPPPEPRSAQGGSIAAQGLAPGAASPSRLGAAGALENGSVPRGGSGSGSPRFVVRESAPVDSGGNPPPGPEAPGSGPIAQAPTQPAPVPSPETAPPSSTPPAGGESSEPSQPEAPKGQESGGQEEGPVSAQNPDEGGGPGRGHGKGPGSHGGPPHPVPPPSAPPPWAHAPSAEDDGPGFTPDGHGQGPGHGDPPGAGHGKGGGPGHSGG